MILVLINVCCQLLSVVKTETVQHEFKVSKNQDINLTIGESSLISSVNKPSRMTYMATCNSNPNCLTAVYGNSQARITNCFIYSRYFKANELIPSSTSIIYEKRLGRLFLILFELLPSLWNVWVLNFYNKFNIEITMGCYLK